MIQFVLLTAWLALNVKNVGDQGSSIELLAAFVVLAIGSVFLRSLNCRVVIRLHFFVFLLLVLWVVLRILIDLGDLEYLKQFTVATTGGIAFFFVVGSLSKFMLDELTRLRESSTHERFILLVSLGVLLLVFLSLIGRLKQTEIFLIEGVNGAYQRPGNLLIIYFLMISFLYISLSAKISAQKINKWFWVLVYSLIFVFGVVSSQLMGSNAATANLVAVYMMTLVISLLANSKKTRAWCLSGRMVSGLSRMMLRRLFYISICCVISMAGFVVLFIYVTGFDVDKLRVFGFGGQGGSVSSRFDILFGSGMDQMGYAPVLGNVNVARIITGEAAKTLHNLIPNVMAELGLVGVLLMGALFFCLYANLLGGLRKYLSESMDYCGFQDVFIKIWLLAVLSFLFVYANVAVGFSWAVMWFYIGLALPFFEVREQKN